MENQEHNLPSVEAMKKVLRGKEYYVEEDEMSDEEVRLAYLFEQYGNCPYCGGRHRTGKLATECSMNYGKTHKLVDLPSGRKKWVKK